MMLAKNREVFVMVLVLVALMSIFVPVVSAGVGSQTWYLCTDPKLDKTAPGADGYPILADSSKDSPAGPAQCVLTMGAGTWTLNLYYNAFGDGNLAVSVWNDDTSTELGHTYGHSISSGIGTTPVDVTGSSVNFDTGDHLMLRLTWSPDDSSSGLWAYCGNGKSTLRSPSTDPGYPVPEMSTLVLFSVGLLALAGYVVYRRKNI